MAAFARWRIAVGDDATTPYAILAVLGFLLAAGPPLGLWPLVYWLPGLNFIRAPSRFMLMAILGLAVTLRDRIRSSRRAILAAAPPVARRLPRARSS